MNPSIEFGTDKKQDKHLLTGDMDNSNGNNLQIGKYWPTNQWYISHYLGHTNNNIVIC